MIKYALFYIKIEYAFMYKNSHDAPATATSFFVSIMKANMIFLPSPQTHFSCALWKENIMFGNCNMNQVINNFVKIE